MSSPHLALPITIEPSKPRLCHDERFLNLWIRDLPFKLDHLADLPRYVLPGHFQTTFEDKSGYQHVRLHPSSETYFGLEWDNFFFVFRTLPFSWKASAHIYHNLGLVVSHAARSLGSPCHSILTTVMWDSFLLFRCVPSFFQALRDLKLQLTLSVTFYSKLAISLILTSRSTFLLRWSVFWVFFMRFYAPGVSYSQG